MKPRDTYGDQPPQLIEQLLESEAKVSSPYQAVVKLLVEQGDIAADSKDDLGRTPLSRAAERGHEALVKLMVKKGRGLKNGAPALT